eukprot:366229-Chlamydomonas_euryale.AAC.10
MHTPGAMGFIGSLAMEMQHTSTLHGRCGHVAAARYTLFKIRFCKQADIRVCIHDREAAKALCRSYVPTPMHGMGTGFDGALYAWGTDDHGTLGQGEGAGNWQRQPIKRPKVVPGMRGIDVKAAVCGWKHSMAVSTGGSLYSWGWNGSYHTDISPAAGQLGQGDDRDRWAPAQVMRLRTNPQKFYDLRMPFLKPWKVVQASAGRNHSAMVVEGEIDARDLA